MADESRRRIFERPRSGLSNTPVPVSDFSVIEEKQWTLQERVWTLRQQVFDVDAALTGSIGGIVETGSLILRPTPQEPCLMSLAPPLHILLLEKNRICNTFWEAIGDLNWSAGMPTNALLISGPSKTAGIEQKLSYGVH